MPELEPWEVALQQLRAEYARLVPWRSPIELQDEVVWVYGRCEQTLRERNKRVRTILFSERELRTAFKQEQGVLLRLASSASCSYGKVGEQLRVQERLWVSDCGKYYAQSAPTIDWSSHDVAMIDGKQWWFWGRYVPTGFDDPDPRYRYPEFPHMVSSWGNLGHTTRSGRYIPAFDLGFGDYNTSTSVRPGTGNTRLASYSADFRRQLYGYQMPTWAERLRIELTAIERLPLNESLRDTPDWKSLHYAFEDRYGHRRETNPLVWRLSYQRVFLKDHAEGKCPHIPVKAD